MMTLVLYLFMHFAFLSNLFPFLTIGFCTWLSVSPILSSLSSITTSWLPPVTFSSVESQSPVGALLFHTSILPQAHSHQGPHLSLLSSVSMPQLLSSVFFSHLASFSSLLLWAQQGGWENRGDRLPAISAILVLLGEWNIFSNLVETADIILLITRSCDGMEHA